MFLNPLGLLALLGVPTVLALHYFRRRFEPRTVSALFLWESRTTTSLSGRRRDRLLSSRSFWAELSLALLLGLAIAGPRSCGGLEARHLVVVLDTSASMSAKADGAAESFAELAAERAADLIDSLPSGSRVTLVASGARPTILSGPAAFPAEALAALESYPASATAGRHDLEPSTSLALQLAGDRAVTLFTDHHDPGRHPDRVGIVALGRPTPNLAIARASRLAHGTAGPGSERVLLTVVNQSGDLAQTRVALDVDDVVLAAKSIELQPRERRHFSFDIPAGTPLLRASLQPDGFALDDTALLAPPPLRALGIDSTLGAELEQRLGFTASTPDARTLDRLLAIVDDSARAKSPDSAHLLFATEPSGGPRTWCLVLHEPAGERVDLVGPFLTEKSNPLLSGVVLDGVVWSAGADVELPGLPLISAGNLPLLTEERDAARVLFHLNLDVARSSLQRSPDWPILLDNLAELRRRELDGPERTSLAIGESFRFRSDEVCDYELETPSGTRELRARGMLVVEDLADVGRYRLRRDGQELAEFAVHFGDDAESDLTQLDAGDRRSSVELAEQRAGTSWVELLLASLALGALLLDWYFLRARRVEPNLVPGAAR
ncbi:MAG: VWA domain-containing protein [Planctomycetes bacterium]|nr:VWA domain-containing protein [Planctomycetota bacterium]MCB9902991.1 VWA domain-containing protein [Planctomycetota bacterium]